MINKAIAKGAEHFTQVERFTMKLVSHPKAVDFYNGLLMDCQHDYIQEQSVFTFTASISTQNLRPVAKKLQCYKPAVLGLSNGFQRISYAGSCLNNDEYESFVELNVKTRDTGIIEDDVLTQTCNADGYLPEGTIPYKTVKDGIQKWLEEQR